MQAETASAAPTPEIMLLTNPPEIGENKLNIKLIDDSGKLPDDLKVGMVVSMPAMGSMPYMEVTADLIKQNTDTYKVDYELPMGGTWDIAVTLEAKKDKKIFRYSATTGISGIIDKNTKNKAAQASEQGSNSATSAGALSLSPERLQRIGVRFALVKSENLIQDIRAVGVVEADSAKRSDIVTRFEAYVLKSTEKRVGDLVKAGEILATVESPELIAAEQEFLFAQDMQGNSHLSGNAAQERLINLGMTKNEVEILQKNKKVVRSFEIKANSGGTLLEVNIRPGTKVSSGQVLFIIGDLRKNYIVAKIFQQDLVNVRVGQKVNISFPNQGKRQIQGKIDLIYPNTTEGSGTVNVRIVANDKTILMQPGSYAEINIPVDFGSKTVIPSEAILHSGINTYVFVDKGNGILDPVEVEIGKYTDTQVEIVNGIKAGERVVSSSTFLLSAEATLRSALPKWKKPALEQSK